MDYFRNIVLVAAIAGVIAGIGMTVAQRVTTVPLILKAEVFEQAEEAKTPPAHVHESKVAGAAQEHEHGGGWAPQDGFERTAFSVAANVLTGIGFALLLIAVSELAGGIVDWRQGVLWGLAAFAVFTLAPGLGLPPELPAMPGAELGTRQIWWIATALSTAGGIALLVYGRSLLAVIAAVALLVGPHIVGAPQPVSHESPIPENLHHSFVIAVVMTTLVFSIIFGCTNRLFPTAVGRHRVTMKEPHTSERARLTLVLGGARSGKSRHAQILAMATPPPWTYVATAEALDDEMRERIAKHRASRGAGWSTIEEPIDLPRAVAQAPADAPLVVDCITLWVSNLMLGTRDVDAAVARFIKCLDGRRAPTIVVSTEVGTGIVPETALGRAFRDQAGLINQQLAMSAHTVHLMVAGLAMPLKALP